MWQWIHHPKGILDDGRKLTIELYETILSEELKKIKQQFNDSDNFDSKIDMASELFKQLTVLPEFEDFLTLQGYRYL